MFKNNMPFFDNSIARVALISNHSIITFYVSFNLSKATFRTKYSDNSLSNSSQRVDDKIERLHGRNTIRSILMVLAIFT